MKQFKLVLVMILAIACMLFSMAGCNFTMTDSTGSNPESTNSEVDSGIVPPSDLENEVWGVEVNTYFTIPSKLTGELTYTLTNEDGEVLPAPTVDNNRIFFDTMGNYTLTISDGSVEDVYSIKVTDTTAPIFYKTTSEMSLTVGLVCNLALLAQATDNSGCEVIYEYEAWYLGTEKEVLESSEFRPTKVGFYIIKIKASDTVGNYFIESTKMYTIKAEDGEVCFFDDNTVEHNGGSIPTNTVCEYDADIKLGDEGYSWKFGIYAHNGWTYTTINSAIDLTSVDAISYFVYIDSNSFTVGNADALTVDVLPRPNGWSIIEPLAGLNYNTWIPVIARKGDASTTYSSTITFMTPNTDGDWYGNGDWEHCSHSYAVRIDRISAHEYTEPAAPKFTKKTSELALAIGSTLDLTTLAEATSSSEIKYEYNVLYLGYEKEELEGTNFASLKSGFYFITIKATDAEGNFSFTTTKVTMQSVGADEICFFDDNTITHGGAPIPTNTVCEYDSNIKLGSEGYSWKFGIYAHNGWTYTTINSVIDLTNVEAISYYVYIDSSSFTVGNADALTVDVLPRPNGWNDLVVLSELAYDTWIHVVAKKGTVNYAKYVTFMTPNTDGDWFGNGNWENCSHAYAVRIDHISAFSFAGTAAAPTFTKTTQEAKATVGQKFDLSTLAEATASSEVTYKYEAWYLGTEREVLDGSSFVPGKVGYYIIKIKALDVDCNYSFTITKLVAQKNDTDEICFFDDNAIEHTGGAYDANIKLGNEGYSWKVNIYAHMGWTYTTINSVIDLTNVDAISYYVYIDSSSFTVGNLDVLNVNLLPRPNGWNDIVALTPIAYDTWIHVVASKGSSVAYGNTVTFMTPNTDGDWFGNGDWEHCSHAYEVRIDHISAYKTIGSPTFTKATQEAKATVGKEFDLSTLAEATASSAVTYKYEAWYLGTEREVLAGSNFLPEKAGHYVIKIKAIDAEGNYVYALTKLAVQKDDTDEICFFDDNAIEHTGGSIPTNTVCSYDADIKLGNEGYSWKFGIYAHNGWTYTTITSVIDLTNVDAISYYVYIDSSSFTVGNLDALNANLLPRPNGWNNIVALTPIAYDTWIHVVASKGTVDYANYVTFMTPNTDDDWFGNGDWEHCSHAYEVRIDHISAYKTIGSPTFTKATQEAKATVGEEFDLSTLAEATASSAVTYKYEAWYLGVEKQVLSGPSFVPTQAGHYVIKIKAIDAEGNYVYALTKLAVQKDDTDEICFFDDNAIEHTGGSIPTNTVCSYDADIKLGNEGYSWKFGIYAHNGWTYTTINSVIDLTNVDAISYYVYIDSSSFTAGNLDVLNANLLPRPNGWNNIVALTPIAYDTWIHVVASKGTVDYANYVTFMTPNTDDDWFGNGDWEHCSHAYEVRIDHISAYKTIGSPTFTKVTQEAKATVGEAFDLSTLAEATAGSAVTYKYEAWYLGVEKQVLSGPSFVPTQAGHYVIKTQAKAADGNYVYALTKLVTKKVNTDEICYFNDNRVGHTGGVYESVIKRGTEGYSWKFYSYSFWSYNFTYLDTAINLTDVEAMSYYVYIDSSSFTAGNADALNVNVLPRPNGWNNIEVLSDLAYDTWIHVVARKGTAGGFGDTLTFMAFNHNGAWVDGGDDEPSGHTFAMYIDDITVYR